MVNGQTPDEPERRPSTSPVPDRTLENDLPTAVTEVGADTRLMDGAVGTPPQIDAQRLVAADPARLLEERLEAYEDIIDSEVGDTTLTRGRNVERELGLRQVYFKFEGGNPSGSQKDRIAFAQALDALRRGFDAMTAATCGNYGAAVALAASLAGLRCIIYIPARYNARRGDEILRYGAEIERCGDDYEEAVLCSKERAERDEVYDANPGGANTPIQLRAYGEIAYEVYDELRDAPAAVAVPVSNGTTLAGIHRGFVSLYRRGKTSRMPRMIAGSSFRKNPIVRAFLSNLAHCEDLEPGAVRETPVNEPLVNWHSIDGDHALQGIRGTGGWAANASDRALLDYTRLLREREGLNVLPASTAGLAALAERHQREALPGDRYVVLLTGRKA
jgi:threonine synthase